MREFWKKLKSIKLAIGLILAIASGSLLATLIPQGLAQEEYFRLYPKIIAELATQAGLTRYFSSLLFLVPALAFFANLAACTIDRMARELRKKGKRRHGPDILHIGLLVLVVGGVVSFSGKEEGRVSLREGESVELPGGEVLTLVRFTDERYEDGRPKAWTSVVQLKKGEVAGSETSIMVNKPLRVGNLTLYQASYASEPAVIIRDRGGKETILARGKSFVSGSFSAFFMTMESPKAPAVQPGKPQALLMIKGSDKDGLLRLSAGEAEVEIGNYGFSLGSISSTGLQAVRDPGYPVVLVALLLIGLGTALTFYQKLKDMNP
ncbi:MAG TPA: cytochrome c biogenesis protein ResB [Rectinemataceae bacterium]